MANRKQEEKVEVSKAATDDISRWRLGEIGVNGLQVFNGVTNEEIRKELNHPESVKTYRLMEYHPSVNAPLDLYKTMVSNLRYRFVPPKNATEEEKKQTEIIASMFDDMEHSFEDFILEAMTCSQYGWAVNEKVFRYRTYASGSKYNDGLFAIRKLPLRSQSSIQRFIFDETGNNVTGVVQSTANSTDPYNRFANRSSTEIKIGRNKFLLFNLGSNRSDPYGTSPLKKAFTSWKYLQAIEELEAASIVKDINGLPLLTAPVQIMAADSSPDQKQQLENMKNMMRNLQQGAQSAVILPSDVNPETRTPLYDLKLITQDGKKSFDLNKVKEYYRTMVFISLGADLLLMGNTTAGSFALGSLKNSQTAATAESFAKRIIQVVNDDLIRELYFRNGWDIARCCKLDYEDIEETDLESLSKAYQRLGATGLLPKTLDVINRGLTSLGVDPLPEDTTEDALLSMLTPETTRSGDGMTQGLNSGTGNADGSSGNASDMNSDNTA